MKHTVKQKILGRSLIIAATLIWGVSFVVLKNTLDVISPLWTMSVRFIIGALIMMLLCSKKLRLINGKYIAVGSALGAALFCAYILQTYGLTLTTPGKNAFLTSAYCVIVPFLGWLVYRAKLDKYNLIAAVICIVGVGFVSLQNDFSVSLGDALTLACSLFFALHIILLDRYVGDMDVMLITMFQFATVGVLSLISAPFFEAPPVLSALFTGPVLLGLAYICVMCTVCAMLCQAFGQRYTPAAETSVLLSFEAVFGAVVSAIFYHEQMSAKLVVGFALIFVAVIISETKLGFLRKAPAEKQ